MKHILLLAASSLTVFVAACGGGSGSTTPPPVTDGSSSTPPTTTPVAKTCFGSDQNSDLEAALRSGDVREISNEGVIIDDIIGTAECSRTAFNDARIKLFNLSADGNVTGDSLTAISWNPTHDAALLLPVFGKSEAVLISNASWQDGYEVRNENLAVIGQTGETRHLALGSHPMRNVFRDASSVNGQMQSFLENALSWITKRDDLKTQDFNVVIAQMAQSFYFPDQNATRSWLDTHYGGSVSYNAPKTCNGAELANCLTGSTDLLMISQWTENEADIDAITEAVETAIANGIPVLYMHYDGGLTALGEKLLPTLQSDYLADNYWRRQSLENYNSAPEFGKLPENIEALTTIMAGFRDNSFNIDLSICENNSCPSESGYDAEFSDPVSILQQQINKLDRSQINIFNEDGRRFEKGLVLLADHYRQSITFPMDKITTPRHDFLKSVFADSVVHLSRDINPAQSDMGNFSRSDFSHITPVTKTVEMTARHRYKAAGVYALPGQTVSVTRNDTSGVGTHIKVNLVRSGSTHLFDEDDYTRPKYMTSQDLPIAPGETISFTSPYGGPVQIRFDDKDQQVNFTFENIGEHPIWRGPEDDGTFAQKLNAGDYDWAELITPSFQVHSKLDKMRTTIDGPIWQGAAAIGQATETHLHNYPHALAGYKGEGIEVIDEIHDFAADNGLEIHTLDTVKHMNADQATCGYGCSGNPYDAYWSFNPLGHGDIHELGHGLERSRFRYQGQPVHATTNPYSYYSKWKYFQTTGDENNLGCQSLPYESLFDTLQASRNSANPFQYMKDQNLTEWNQGAAINIQIMMAAQDLGILEDGWHLLARQHIIEREFSRADDNDDAWANKKDGLGFGSFTRTEARALSNNDWNLIALSHALQLDLTDYLEMWGFDLSTTAKTHVAAWGYESLPLNYYTAEPTAHCKGFTSDKLPVDGTQSWPASKGVQKIQSKIEPRKLASDHVCSHDAAQKDH